MMGDRTCELCGADFHAPACQIRRGGGRFCSVRCRAIACGDRVRERRVLLKCPRCGKEILVPVSVAKKRTHCSAECARKQSVPCPTCKNPFVPRAGQTYCSMACYGPHRKKAAERPIVLCVVCGKFFPVSRGTFGRCCSMKCVGALTANRTAQEGYSRSKGGRRADLDNRYFRSSWEANWARYLNCLRQQGQIVDWQYEPDTFEFVGIKCGARFYTPDFRVTNIGGSVEYHEIKGWMDARSATKLRRMAKYHPSIKVVLVERPAYDEVAKKLGKILPGWEWGHKKSRFLRYLPEQLTSGQAVEELKQVLK